jgi:hypothetical protein
MVNEPPGKPATNALSEMAVLAKLIMRIGPDIDLIARISGQYKETIRYRYKEKILAKGFKLQARVNYEGLSLTRVVAKVGLNGVYASHAREIFLVMNRSCYLTSYTQLLPEGIYMVHLSVPAALRDAVVGFVEQLRGMGVFDSVEFYKFDWFRTVPMRTEFYDFEHQAWDFDWTKMVGPSKDDGAGDYRPFRFDRTDLLILKEMQIDATRPLSDVRQAIMAKDGVDINYKTLAWHWIKHVQEKKMINGYALRWTGTRHDSQTERTKDSHPRYVMVAVFVRAITDSERAALVGQMNRVPFLWCEAAGEDYYAQLAFPLEMVNDAFLFLKDVISGLGGRASYHVADQGDSIELALPYQMFDNQEKRWIFEEPELRARFESLLLEIRDRSGMGRGQSIQG